jgi:hypothetical protein
MQKSVSLQNAGEDETFNFRFPQASSVETQEANCGSDVVCLLR